MAITSTVTPASGIYPNEAYGLDWDQSMANNTFYTILNISGKGCFTRLSFASLNVSGANNLKMRVTIDGGTARTSNINAYPARGMTHRTAGNVQFGEYSYDWWGQAYFKTSILVEVAQVSGGSNQGWAAIDYSLQV